MIWIIVFIIILVFAAKSFFDISIDMKSDYCLIYYSYKGRRYVIALWGSNI